MIYTVMTKKAMRIAYNAHKEQIDPSGVPYIFHPIAVAEKMDCEFSTCAALLHDVVEDTDVTLEYLRGEFPPEVTDAVALLTHEDSADYFDYLRRIRANPIALKVKLADLAHNTDESRLAGSDIPHEKLEHWRAKYAKARAVLTGDI